MLQYLSDLVDCALIAMLASIAILGVTSTRTLSAFLCSKWKMLSSLLELRTARHIWDMPACYFDENYAIVSDFLLTHCQNSIADLGRLEYIDPG